jgi:hypothetical protein
MRKTSRSPSPSPLRRPMLGAVLAAAAALLSGSVACSVVLDRNAVQCQTDSDCAHFGQSPVCQGGVCVSSGLGPAGCFGGTPRSMEQFLNQCSTSACFSFDNCERLGLCGGATDMDAALPSPPVPEASAPATPMSTGTDGGPSALPLCADASNGRGQVLVMTGSSNFPPLLAKLAPLVLAAGFTPVFQVSSSCGGVASIFSTDPSKTTLFDPAPGTTTKPASYFKPDGSSVACSLGPAGLPVDVGESDIFSSTCSIDGTPAGSVGEFLGPIQAMVFVVPGRSQQNAITADAARAVFGMGGGKAQPWTDPSLYFVRNANTGTQQMIGHAINVPAGDFWGVDRGTAANVDALMKDITDPSLAQQAIGIISADYYDADRSNLKALAFQASTQDCAYLPDSTPYRKDKRSVRDGHYPIWGPVHFFAATVNGIPATPGAQAFVSIVSVPNIPQPLLDAFIGSSLVPSCAMTVTRSSELGALSTYQPPFECGCYFEASPAVEGTPPAGCSRCQTAADCTDPSHPACNLGFCEKQ